MGIGKRYMTKGIEQPNQEKIRTLIENETYKHLGILGTENIKQVDIKKKKDVYLKRTKKVTWDQIIYQESH